MIEFLLAEYLKACEDDNHIGMEYWMGQMNELIDAQIAAQQ